MAFTLADIRQVVRNVTGRPNPLEFSDTLIDDYINKYYLYVMQEDFKPSNLLVDYKFNTLANQVTYTFDLTKYMSLEPGFFINGNQLLYYQDRSLWLRDFQYQYQQTTADTGDGSTVGFTGTLGTGLIVPGTVIFTDNAQVFTDGGDGNLYLGTPPASPAGTINYTTGVYSITFTIAPVDGQPIYATYAPIINGRPRAIYYDGAGTIQFSPIPDTSYTIEGSAYILPTAFLGSDDASVVGPILAQWGYTIAYGAALEIFRQAGQLDQRQAYQPEYDRHMDQALSIATQQSTNQRTVPKW